MIESPSLRSEIPERPTPTLHVSTGVYELDITGNLEALLDLRYAIDEALIGRSVGARVSSSGGTDYAVRVRRLDSDPGSGFWDCVETIVGGTK